jgi:hypothetical protein
MTDPLDSLQLFPEGAGGELEAPVVYIASPLSSLDDDGRRLVSSWSREIDAALAEATSEADVKWNLRTHAPSVRSAPWRGDRLTEREVFELNRGTVLQEADGVIAIGYRGGSYGAGQELGWAASVGTPVLFLVPKGDPISRQISGFATEADLEIVEFEDDPKPAVRTWIVQRRHAIEDGPRRRRERAASATALQSALRNEWAKRSPEDRTAVCAIARMQPARVSGLVEQPGLTAAASLDELNRLAGALGLEVGRYLAAAPPPQLSGRQLGALAAAASEYNWDGVTTLRLADRGRRELARGGIRRLPLATVEDWVRFKKDVRL